MRDSLVEKGILGELRKYCNERGIFRFTVTNVTSCTHPYVYDITKKPNSMLIANLYDVKQNIVIADYAWVNINKTLLDLELKPGDIVEASYYAEKYRAGKEYFPLNTIRRPNNFYRLKWINNAHIIGHEDIIDPLSKPVIDLQTGISYKSFYSYCEDTPFCRTKEDFELLVIQLIDSLHYIPIWLKLGTMRYKRVNIKPVHRPRRGVKLPKDWKRYKKVCKLRQYNLYNSANIRPNIMFQYIYDKTTKEQRDVLVNYNCTPPIPITDVTPATDNTIKHEYEDAGFTGFRFKKS